MNNGCCIVASLYPHMFHLTSGKIINYKQFSEVFIHRIKALHLGN